MATEKSLFVVWKEHGEYLFANAISLLDLIIGGENASSENMHIWCFVIIF